MRAPGFQEYNVMSVVAIHHPSPRTFKKRLLVCLQLCVCRIWITLNFLFTQNLFTEHTLRAISLRAEGAVAGRHLGPALIDRAPLIKPLFLRRTSLINTPKQINVCVGNILNSPKTSSTVRFLVFCLAWKRAFSF